MLMHTYEDITELSACKQGYTCHHLEEGIQIQDEAVVRVEYPLC